MQLPSGGFAGWCPFGAWTGTPLGRPLYVRDLAGPVARRGYLR